MNLGSVIDWIKSRGKGPAPASGSAGGNPHIDIGWLVDFDRARFVFEAPRAVARKPESPGHAKAVGFCPAIIEHEARTFEIPCPFDLNLRLETTETGHHRVVDVRGPKSPVAARNLNAMIVMTHRDQWRHADRPVIQIAAPWRFLADEPVWMTQMPAYGHYRQSALPGLQIGGRFPIHIWPRILMWAFEWHDTTQPLRLRRGEPWFYLGFETAAPERPLRLLEAAMTPELRHFCQGIDGISGFVRGTRKFYEKAAANRPARLLVPKSSRDKSSHHAP